MRVIRQGTALCLALLILLGARIPVAAGRPTGNDARNYLPFTASDAPTPAPTCQAAFTPVGAPLTDLGDAEYIRMGMTPTGFHGGLYPGGANTRPPAHEAAGLAAAGQILPRDAAGQPAADGKIGMVSVGMSNTSMEFLRFMARAAARTDINPHFVLVNGALPNQTAGRWADPNGVPWTALDATLSRNHLTNAQVQVVWIKLTYAQGGAFPDLALQLQGDLTTIVHLLHARFPNLKIVFLSSRTRSYNMEHGLSPEPSAYETGFAVKWLIEGQINGDPALNDDPANGPVTAPYLSWGPYLWIDGLNPRADGRVWPGANLTQDCTHPSSAGIDTVADMLMAFYTTDSLTKNWFRDQK